MSGTDKYQLRTQKYQFGTDKYQLRTQKYQFGTDKYRLGTQKYRFGTDKYQLRTQKYQFGTDKYRLGTQKYLNCDYDDFYDNAYHQLFRLNLWNPLIRLIRDSDLYDNAVRIK
ncbi:MAG: hypothetical protein WCJ01_04815 [Ignavibacteria bacterium]